MASKKAECRLSLINHAYLSDLAKLGAYGSGRAGVVRQLIEKGIQDALEKGVIKPRDVSEFGEEVEGEGDVD